MINVLFAAPAEQFDTYHPLIEAALKAHGIDARIGLDMPADQVDYIVFSPKGPVSDFTPFSRAKAVLSLWAGVERIESSPGLTQPLCRMVDGGLKQGMREWVAGHVLRHHLGMDADILNPEHRWQPRAVPLAGDRRVGILGTGELGQACARTLHDIGFDVAGWSRRPKTLDGIAHFDGGDGLETILKRSDILVLLLPQTLQTRHIINADTLALMPRGAVIINPGRGPLIDDTALLDALNRGDLGHATLDVFEQEPLPQAHPFWAHPRVTVTPHIASETRPASAAKVIAQNIYRGETGQPLLYLVDRKAGY